MSADYFKELKNAYQHIRVHPELTGNKLAEQLTTELDDIFPILNDQDSILRMARYVTPDVRDWFKSFIEQLFNQLDEVARLSRDLYITNPIPYLVETLSAVDGIRSLFIDKEFCLQVFVDCPLEILPKKMRAFANNLARVSGKEPPHIKQAEAGKSEPAAGTVEFEQINLTTDQLSVLECLYEKKSMLQTQVNVETATGITRKTIGKILPGLVGYGFVEKKTKGSGITSKGITFVEQHLM